MAHFYCKTHEIIHSIMAAVVVAVVVVITTDKNTITTSDKKITLPNHTAFQH
jgi:ABC-type uncharacterized transport system permease subunit